jgi:hypothetical protein
MTVVARVLRSDHPVRVELIASGWVIDSTSWGAPLRVDGAVLERLEHLVGASREQGVAVEELTSNDAAQIAALESITFPDYPQTHATFAESSARMRQQRFLTRGGFSVFADEGQSSQ